MGKGALPDFPVSWFTVTQGLAPWLDLYKLFWRFQQLKDGLEWNVFPLRWWVVKPDLGMGSEVKWRSEVKSLSRVQLFATPWTVTHQAPPSMGFFRQEYWSGLPFPSPGDLSDPGIKPRSPALQADALGKINVKTALSFLFQPPAGLLQGAVWGGVSRCLYRISMVTSPVFLLSAIFFNTPIPPSSYLNVPSSLFFFSSILMQEFPSWQI